ncbi:MAG: HYR domain-containing protein [Bacteroidota bacterium]
MEKQILHGKNCSTGLSFVWLMFLLFGFIVSPMTSTYAEAEDYATCDIFTPLGTSFNLDLDGTGNGTIEPAKFIPFVTSSCVVNASSIELWTDATATTPFTPNNVTCADVGTTFNVWVTVNSSQNPVPPVPQCISTAIEFQVTVNDGMLPTIVCPGNLTVTGCTAADAPAPYAGAAAFASAGGTIMDNCGATLSLVSDNVLSGNGCPATPFLIERVYRATDPSGNIADCTQQIKVVDDVNPTPVCVAGPINKDLDANCMAVVTAAEVDGGSSDNCTTFSDLTVEIKRAGAAASTYGNSITYTVADLTDCPTTLAVDLRVTDACGNSMENLACANVVIRDVTAPTLTCPANEVILTSNNGMGDCNALATITPPTPMDNCGVNLASYMIDIKNPSGVSLAGYPQLAVAGATINETFAKMPTCTDDTYTVSYTVTDNCGNPADCSYTIRVRDDEAPIIAGCPDNITKNTVPADCYATATWTPPTATDNCHPPGGALTETLLITYPDGTTASSIDIIAGQATGIFPKGTTTVKYTFTDCQTPMPNSADCIFTITVNDTEDPTAMCVADFTTNLGPLNLGETKDFTFADFDAGSFDNCMIVKKEISDDGATFGETLSYGCTDAGTTKTITLKVTDMSGNEGTCTLDMKLLGGNLSLATNSINDVRCNGANDGAIYTTVTGGSGPYNYQWDGFPSTAPYGQPQDNAADQTELYAGTYGVTVTDANGCTASVTGITITEPTAVTVSIGSVINADCAGNETGSATASASGGTGPYTYAWSNGQAGAAASNLHAGGYVVVATDANGCTGTAATSISDPNGLQIAILQNNQVSCNGGSDGSVELGILAIPTSGTPPYTLDEIFKDGAFLSAPNTLFPLGNAPLTVSNLEAGQYTFIVEDTNGCRVVGSTTVDEPTLLIAETIDTTNALCNGSLDGTATVNATGGTTPYTYLWSSGSTNATATGLALGTYTATVTDAEGCTATTTANVGQPTPLLASVASTINVSCNGGSDGSIELTVSGGTAPYSYQWSGNIPADDVQDALNIPAGAYSVVITDANGCTFAINGINISEPASLTLAIGNITNADCIGNETGSATATASGGTGPYTYAWSNGQNTATATDLHAGGYLVIATDANGCTASAATTITDPSGIFFTTSGQTDVSCNGGNDGSATFVLGGGTPGYVLVNVLGPGGSTGGVILGQPISNNATISNLPTGQYTFLIADANFCFATTVVVIKEPTELLAEIIHQEDVVCPGDTDGEATVNATGGTTPYTYLWSASAGSQTTNIATNLPAGSHSVTVTDANGCTDVATVTILQNDDVAPEFVTTIPGDVTVECDAIPAPFVLIPAWHTTDNCSDPADIMVTFTETIQDQICPNTFTIKRKWEIKDEAGNTAFHIQKVRVQDTTKPTFTVPADVTIECDESTMPANTGDVTDQMDNCSAAADVVVAFTDVIDLSGCGNYTGTITRTWTATDECGNVETKVQIITIVDTTAPVAVCQNVTIQLDANGLASITAADIENGSTDNCATTAQLTFALDKTDFTCADLGENTVTLSVTDPCGNTGSCTAIVTVEDNILPVINCPQDVVFFLDPGACEQVFSFDVTATDNCDVTVAQTGGQFSSGDAFPIGGPYILTYTATDAAGNTATCSFSVEVVEFQSTSNDLTCNSLVNLSLDETCTAVVDADMILEGNNYGCYDDYIIEITDVNGNILPGNLLTLANVGQTLSVSIIDPNTGNSCWGELLVEDKLIPTFDCPADVDVFCNDETDPQFTGEPVLTSCESSVDISFEDVFTDFECAGAPTNSDVRATIVRTWTVSDDSGNTDSCVQIINILKPIIANVTWPTDKDEINDNALDCGDVAADPDLTNPEHTGFPQFNNKDILPGGLCAFSIGFEDEILHVCAGGSSYEILRTWTVRDMCLPLSAGTNPIKHIQSIKVLDTTGPDLVCPAPLTLSPGNNSCQVNVTLPPANVSDDCSGFEVVVETPFGTVLENGGPIPGLYGLGDHTVTYVATDACGNISTCEYTFSVVDLTAPIAICDENTVAGIGSDGVAIIEALTFDDGSYDNCGNLTYEVRKMTDGCGQPANLAFGPLVAFCCEEIGSTIMVELRVTDDFGNTNSCMVDVEVQDKLDPIIICPSNKTISCDDDADPALTGEAVATDNCGVASITFTDIANTVDCGFGTITRVWTATDNGGRTSSCIQFIFVENADVFNITDTECRSFPLGASHTLSDDVEWPCDVELTTCGLGLSPDELITNGVDPRDARPEVFEGACDNIAITFDDTVLEFGAQDACLKILRKWIIIDWCQATANQDPTQVGPGVWHYTQVIKVINSNDPAITVVDLPAVIENFDPNCGNAFAAFEITADDDCTAQADLDVTWEFSTGTTGTGFSATGSFANGAYSLTFTVDDQCGNTSIIEHDFEVIDAKQPTPVCIFGIASVIMPSSGSVVIWASDFESGSSYDNCTPYEQLQFTFSPIVAGQPLDDNITINCADIPASGLFPITLYVTDASGNFDFCSTFIDVQDPNGACGTVASVINGAIENENQEMIEEVTVNLTDASGAVAAPVMTGNDGTFQFNGMTYGDYDVTPEKDINYLNGVTTYDLVLISKHILGIDLLDSPYKIIAADANNSQTITTLDIVKLRALILYIDLELTNNNSWRFVDQNYVFPNPLNPWTETFPEYADLDGISTAPVNFTAVKVGDVNGSAAPNSLLGSTTRTFDGQLALQAKATEVAAGETFTVDFRAKDFNNIAGYQFTLGFDNATVDFVDVISNLAGLTIENFGLTRLEEGVITTSWNSAAGVSMDDDAVLFSVTFKATTALNTKDVLTINSRYTEAEAYNTSDLFDVVLEFNGAEVASGFELYQNTPNPFKAETTIGFNVPQAGTVTLTIMDVSGRTLSMMEMDAAKGYNAVIIDRASLEATGVLYYQVETATETATKKMIIVD